MDDPVTLTRATIYRDTLERKGLMTDEPSAEILPMVGAPTGRQIAPRAVRNNNPGNIEKGTKWIGLAARDKLTPEQRTEPRFAVFAHPKYGFRAMATTILTYARKRRARDGSAIDTVGDVIARWAPPIENDTGSYARIVAQAVGVKPDALVDLESYAVLAPMLKAMSKHEAGGWFFKDADLDEGLYLAGIVRKTSTPSEKREALALGFAGSLAGIGGVAAIIAQLRDAYTQAKPMIDEWTAFYAQAPAAAIVAAMAPVAYLAWRYIRRMHREKS